MSGSVRVVSDAPIGGMLRYDLPAIGEAVPEDNHARFKAFCAIHKTKMAEEINAFIKRRITEVKE